MSNLTSVHKKIGLALSGGALRGVFHIGVLRALEDLKIPIHAISGTSSGAVVGALYLEGIPLKEILKIIKKSSFLKMLRPGVWNRGLLNLNYLKSILEEHLASSNFRELERPFYVTATNLKTGELDIFHDGELIPTILASCSIPIIFEPIKIGKGVYVDGGVLMNLPATPLKNLHYQTIGINLVPEITVDDGDLNSFLKMAVRSFDLSVLNNIRPELDQCDVIISMDELHKVGRFSFKKVDDLNEMGYKATMDKKNELAALQT